MAHYHIRQIGLDGHDLTAMIDFGRLLWITS
jgi:hypothetical protein